MSTTKRQQWSNQPESLREMLLYHVISTHLARSAFENEGTHSTLAGTHRLRINIYSGQSFSNITNTDIDASEVNIKDKIDKFSIYEH